MIKVRSIAEQGSSPDRILYLVSQLPSTPPSIIGPANACLYIGTTNRATYSIPRDPAATGYIWGAPASTIVTHPNQPGVNDTIILLTFKPGYKTGSVTVQALNNCGFSAARGISVSGVAPATPGAISGPRSVCANMLPGGTAATYTISPVPGASSYTWVTPAGCLVTHLNDAGPNDVGIKVQYPDVFVSGVITVTANSGCDESLPRSISINKLNVGTPGVITGTQKVVCPNREYSYILPAMPANATSVMWTVPPEAIGFSGQGTAGITVFYPESMVIGLVTVKAFNNCSSSATRQSTVRLNRCQLEFTGTSNNNNANSSMSRGMQNAQQPVIARTMEVNVSPNPSEGDFKILVSTPGKEMINIRVLDIRGREIKKMSVVPNQSFLFGSQLNAGTYILEVSQGKNQKTQKLMKL